MRVQSNLEMDPVNFVRRGQVVAQNTMRFGPIIYTIMSLLSPGFQFFTEMDRQMDLMQMPNENNIDTFDFIIGKIIHNSVNVKFDVFRINR